MLPGRRLSLEEQRHARRRLPRGDDGEPQPHPRQRRWRAGNSAHGKQQEGWLVQLSLAALHQRPQPADGRPQRDQGALRTVHQAQHRAGRRRLHAVARAPAAALLGHHRRRAADGGRVPDAHPVRLDPRPLRAADARVSAEARPADVLRGARARARDPGRFLPARAHQDLLPRGQGAGAASTRAPHSSSPVVSLLFSPPISCRTRSLVSSIISADLAPDVRRRCSRSWRSETSPR